METSQVESHSQSQDRHETASLLRDAPLLHQNAARGGLVDPEHAEALMALALNATGLAAFTLWTSYVSFSRGCPGPCPQNAPTRCDGVPTQCDGGVRG